MKFHIYMCKLTFKGLCTKCNKNLFYFSKFALNFLNSTQPWSQPRHNQRWTVYLLIDFGVFAGTFLLILSWLCYFNVHYVHVWLWIENHGHLFFEPSVLIHPWPKLMLNFFSVQSSGKSFKTNACWRLNASTTGFNDRMKSVVCERVLPIVAINDLHEYYIEHIRLETSWNSLIKS